VTRSARSRRASRRRARRLGAWERGRGPASGLRKSPGSVNVAAAGADIGRMSADFAENVSNGSFTVTARNIFLASLFCVAFGSAAWADAQIVVEFNLVGHLIEPRDAMTSLPEKFTFVVTNDRKVHIYYNSPNYVSQGIRDQSFEQPFATNASNGLVSVRRVRIENNSVIYAEFFGSYKKVITATMRADNTCSASVTYELLPGHEYFESGSERTHAPNKSLDLHAENVTCAISTQSAR